MKVYVICKNDRPVRWARDAKRAREYKEAQRRIEKGHVV
jgi:hypothetical protein